MEVIHKAVSYTGQEVQGFFVKRTNGAREMNLIDQNGSMVEIDIDTLDLYSIDGRIVQAHANNQDSITIYLEPLEKKELVIINIDGKTKEEIDALVQDAKDKELDAVIITEFPDDEVEEKPVIEEVKKPKKAKKPATFDKEEFEPPFNPLVD